MKAQILKIAGVKDEKSFYKKFPSEEAFMKVHGKAFKKAQAGWNSQPFSNTIDFENTGIGTMGDLQLLQGENPMMKPLQMRGMGQNQLVDQSKLADMGKRKGSKAAPGILGGIGDKINIGGKVLDAAFALRDEKRKVKSTGQWADVSKVVKQASELETPYQQHKYIRPEDRVDTGEEFFPIHGVGTNVIQKNGGEIQNTYAPKTLYKDLGEAQYGAEVWGGPASDMIHKTYSMFGRESAGGNMGNTLGGAIGGMFGPLGQVIGGGVGEGIGRLLDKNPAKIEKNQEEFDRNMGMVDFGNAGKSLHNQYQGSMKNGGWMNPQIISNFGGNSVNKLFTPDPTMDTLRIGGHLRQEEFDLGGELQVYRGEAEPISQNKYLPEGGQTVMFRGPSHAEGGMPIKFGGQGVEVEGGEPAVKLEDGGSAGENNLVVFGNLPIHNAYLPLLGDPDAKGKKFKNYINTLSKKEDKSNKLIDSSVTKLDETPMSTSFDKLKFDGLKANIMGANMTLKSIAEKKQTAASLQDAINHASETHGLVAEDLARGVIKKAKPKKTAEDGIEFKTKGIRPGSIDYNPIAQDYNKDFWNSEENYKKNWIPKVEAAFADPTQAANLVSRIENYSGQDAEDVKLAISKGKTPAEKIAIAKRLGTDTKIGPYHKLLAGMIAPEAAQVRAIPPVIDIPEDVIDYEEIITKDEYVPLPEQKKPSWMNAINEMIPYMRPSDAEHLDPRQLAGEMYAMSNNQIEPVPAQTVQPQLDVPYDISYQDLLNRNRGIERGAERIAQNNPAMLAQLNAQKYGANQQVLGEQFRQNQAEKAKVYGQNRQLINEALFKNLGILDNQYQRQEGSKAATKATTLAALSSISDKFLRNQLENRTLQVGENTYNYRYDSQGRLINMNPLAQFDVSGSNAVGANAPLPEGKQYTYTTDASGNLIKEDIKSKPKAKTHAANGAFVQALKRI